MKGRAAFWYRKIPDGELKGLDKSIIENRLAEIADSVHDSDSVEVLKIIGDSFKAQWGTWTMGPNGLDCTNSGRVLLPYAPPAEYDLSITFTRNSGNDSLGFFCPVGKGTVVWALGGMHGFVKIIGNNGWHYVAEDKQEGHLTNHVPHICEIRVRKTGVQAYVDGKLDFQLATDGTEFQNDLLKISGEAVLGLHAQDTATFSKVVLTEVTGHGHVLIPAK